MMKDKTSQASTVISIKFASLNHPEVFVRDFFGQQVYQHKFDICLCNIKQTFSEQEKFKQYLAPFFKDKRAIFESFAAYGNRVMINKNDKIFCKRNGIKIHLRNVIQRDDAVFV